MERQTHPVVVIDATECVLSRPSNTLLGNILYSGYKKKHTFKYEVTVSEKDGIPLSIIGPVAGPTADIEIYRLRVRGILKKRKWLGLADGTYQGDYKFLVVPPRPYKNLTDKQRLFHMKLSKRRVIVENFFSRVKNFQCLCSRWRHNIYKHKWAFHVIVNSISIDLEYKPLIQ